MQIVGRCNDRPICGMTEMPCGSLPFKLVIIHWNRWRVTLTWIFKATQLAVFKILKEKGTRMRVLTARCTRPPGEGEEANVQTRCRPRQLRDRLGFVRKRTLRFLHDFWLSWLRSPVNFRFRPEFFFPAKIKQPVDCAFQCVRSFHWINVWNFGFQLDDSGVPFI